MQAQPSSAAQLAALEAFVLDNDDLSALEEQVGRFNVFDALGIAHMEIRHSNFLAWLLDPAESHGQGHLFLKAMLIDLLRRAPESVRPFTALELDGSDVRGVDVRREWQHIDVLVTGEEPRFGLVIENKVGSGEHGDQLSQYANAYRAKYGDRPTLFVFLTVTGEEATKKDWLSYTYADVHRVLTRCRRANSGALGDDVGMVLDHYLRLIGFRFMNDPKIEALCRQIYRNHRQALELIYDVVGAGSNGVLAAVEELVRADADCVVYGVTGQRVDFAPREWAAVTPPLCTLSNHDKRFWLRCWFGCNAEGVRFYVEIGPCSDADLRLALIDRLVGLQRTGLKKKGKVTPTWTRLLSETLVEWEGDPDPEEVKATVGKALSELKVRLSPVTPVLQELFKRTQN